MKPANFDPTYQALLGGAAAIIASGIAGESVFKAKPVRVATTAAGTLASSFENGDTVDGIVLAEGDRILVKDQAAGAENGIYVVEATGAPTRAADSDSSGEIVGSLVAVITGTANGGTFWRNTNTSAVTLGTTALTFAQVAVPLTVKEEGVALATAATSLDFVGAGVVASGTGAAKTITILGATSSDQHAHIDNLAYSGDGTTTAYVLPAAPFDADSVAAYVEGVRVPFTLSGTLLDTMTLGFAPASGTDNITVDVVAVLV